MGRVFALLDTGTHDSLLKAASFIAMLQNRQVLQVACPEEISFHRRLEQIGVAVKVISGGADAAVHGQFFERVNSNSLVGQVL
jgi:glucose-1-phosphate thymidylyltransferase